MSTVYFRLAARAPIALERAPLLEGLLARADAEGRVTDWRAQAFRVIAREAGAMPPIAAAALRAASQGTAARGLPGAWGCVATPVHLQAGLSRVCMAADGILELDPAEADALVADFNRVFSGAGMQLVRGRENLLLCIFDAPLRVTTIDPQEVLGQDLWAFLPGGADAPRLRRLMSEIEMWLHEHTVNADRRARAQPPISGLWLWGEGAADTPLPTVQGWAAGNDPLFAAFGNASQYPIAAGAGVVVIADLPGTAAWREAEQRWLLPAIAELRAGRLKRIDLSLGQRCFSVSARGRWRFWRRPRPWWEAFGVGGAVAVGDNGTEER